MPARSGPSCPKESREPCYLVVNADEGEPGTFKIEPSWRRTPRRREGCIIGCSARRATGYVYVRDELHLSRRVFGGPSRRRRQGISVRGRSASDTRSTRRAHRRRRVHLRRGDEPAQLARGPARGLATSRVPAQLWRFGCPTTVNNPRDRRDSAGRCSRSAVTPSAACRPSTISTTEACACSRERPRQDSGVFECAVGLTLRELIYDLGGGILGDKQLLAVMPGGSSCPGHVARTKSSTSPVIRASSRTTAERAGPPMGCRHHLRMVGGMLGLLRNRALRGRPIPCSLLHNLMRFYKHESCGQVHAVREGCGLDRPHPLQDRGGGGTIEGSTQLASHRFDITATPSAP